MAPEPHVTEPLLTAERVQAVFADCLFRAGEDTREHVAAEGIRATFGFHPGRLREHTPTIALMLSELPGEFRAGASFLAACSRRDGTQWTGLHQRMEELLTLGQATGNATLLAPRSLWSRLPGGMPYFSVRGV